MKRLFVFLLILYSIIYNVNSRSLRSNNNLYQISTFILERKSAYSKLPDSLGGVSVHGFAVISLTYDIHFHLEKIELLKLQVRGSKIVDYWYSSKITKDAIRYLPFFKKYALTQKIKINKGVTLTSNENEISFIVRFGTPPRPAKCPTWPK